MITTLLLLALMIIVGFPVCIVVLLVGGPVAAHIFEFLHFFWGAVVVAEATLGFLASQPRAFVILVVVLVPGVAMLKRELAVPLSVRRLVDLMDVDVTALTEQDEVPDAVVGIVTVDVVERELRLCSRAEVGFRPFLQTAPTDDTGFPPSLEYRFFE